MYWENDLIVILVISILLLFIVKYEIVINSFFNCSIVKWVSYHFSNSWTELELYYWENHLIILLF